jgi:hypothetical protein
MNFGNTDDLVAWISNDLHFHPEQHIVVGVPSPDVGEHILHRVSKQTGAPYRKRHLLRTAAGGSVHIASTAHAGRGIQARVYMHWDAPFGLDRALAPCEVDHA